MTGQHQVLRAVPWDTISGSELLNSEVEPCEPREHPGSWENPLKICVVKKVDGIY